MRQYSIRFFVLIAFLCDGQRNVQAVQWQALNGSARYKVAYDEQSIRTTSLGRLELRLRFIPRGESARKSAATEYKEKHYQTHLERYELDCSEQTALLVLIDILGASREKIKRLPGGTQSEPILPGSVLDGAAQLICPVSDKDSEDIIEDAEPIQTEEPATTTGMTLSVDKLRQIEDLQKKTQSKEATAETWKELGNLYFDTDQPEKAIKAYDRALFLRPQDPDALNDLGAMYRQTGDFVRALANFEKANSIDPHNLESLYNSGYVYFFDLNNIAKALVMWRRYLELEKKSETAQQVQLFIDLYGK